MISGERARVPHNFPLAETLGSDKLADSIRVTETVWPVATILVGSIGHIGLPLDQLIPPGIDREEDSLANAHVGAAIRTRRLIRGIILNAKPAIAFGDGCRCSLE